MLLYDFYSNDTRQVYHICPLMMSGESATVGTSSASVWRKAGVGARVCVECRGCHEPTIYIRNIPRS